MNDDEDFSRLSHEEAMLKLYWNDVVKHVKRYLAYIWTDEVRRDFKAIEKEAERISFILARIARHKR